MASRQHRPHRGLRSSSTWLKPLSNAVAQSGHGLTKFLVYMGQSVRLMGERWASLGLGFSAGLVFQGSGRALPSDRDARPLLQGARKPEGVAVPVGAALCRERGAKRPRHSQIKVSIRSVLVDPGLPKGTPAVISSVSPRLAMPCAWAISRAVETTSST